MSKTRQIRTAFLVFFVAALVLGASACTEGFTNDPVTDSGTPQTSIGEEGSRPDWWMPPSGGADGAAVDGAAADGGDSTPGRPGLPEGGAPPLPEAGLPPLPEAGLPPLPEAGLPPLP